MKLLTPDDLIDLASYGPRRTAYRRAVIECKRNRRLAVGPSLSLVFENRETLRFQVLEMLWVERITKPERVQQELDVYNELMPGENDLSATLFVEIPELDRIRPALDQLVGIDEHVVLRLGEAPDTEQIRACFDPKQMEEDRISAVQYIRFRLSEVPRARFTRPELPARIDIDHPNYRHSAALPEGLRHSLIADLAGELGPLLSPDA